MLQKGAEAEPKLWLRSRSTATGKEAVTTAAAAKAAKEEKEEREEKEEKEEKEVPFHGYAGLQVANLLPTSNATANT